MHSFLVNIIKFSFLLFCFWIFGAKSASAQFAHYEIRGMMIYHFGHFVSWPERVFSQNNKMVLGILGDDPFGTAIDDILRNRRVRGRLWEVRRAAELDDLKGCHIIFVTQSKKNQAQQILQTLRSKRYRHTHTLTIGDDIEDFCRYGGIINVDNNNFFTINSEAANRANLIIDSRLWQMAKSIEAYGEER